ncbi:MAG: methyltransferase domain-containing protein [Chitinophagales bacterium]|jgi:16S rRNA (cytosine967-C5)-methyltransferase|nr:methyltransferase domain-containing protein [Chitinophagales bacterium]
MKLHPNIKNQVLKALDLAISNPLSSEEIYLKFSKENKKWGARDRKTFAALFYDIYRYYKLLDFRYPDKDLVEAYLEFIEYNDFSKISEQIEASPNIKHSCSEFFWDKSENQINEKEWLFLNKKAAIYLNINTNLISLLDFSDLLKQAKIAHEVIDMATVSQDKFPISAIKINQRVNFQADPFLSNSSYFEIQDLGSQIPISTLPELQNGLIVDFCAGQGGKSIQLLKKFSPKSKLISTDIDEQKLNHLSLRAQRLNFTNFETKILDQSFLDTYQNKVDLLVLDAPCSGSGTIRRQISLKYHITKHSLEKNIILQRSIIENAINLVKSEGLLLYITCSIFTEENQAQRDFILEKKLVLVSEYQVFSSENDSDSFYFCLFRKK